jgi:TRAP-type mannitol/chloroaromatic compound transport system permease small subunit
MLARIESFIDWVGRATSWLALAIVVLMAANVILRYFFSFGSVWAQELEWHLLAPLILFGIAYALQKGEHVRVDVAYTHFTAKNKERVNLLAALLCLAISVIVIWLSIHYVQQSYVIGEKSSDPGGLTHRWVLKALIPIGFVLLLLQSAVEVAKSWLKLRDLGK